MRDKPQVNTMEANKPADNRQQAASQPPPQSPPQSATAQQTTDRLLTIKLAINELRMAISELRPDSICMAYEKFQKLANAAHLEDALKAIEQSLGICGRDVVVSAYTLRTCMMCTGGMITCNQCHGTGKLEGDRKCMRCDGLGVEPCDMCLGTGWGDIKTIPTEIRPYVLKRYLAQTQADINQMGASLEKLTPDALKQMNKPKLVKLAVWLIKLQARLTELSKTEIARTPEEKAKFLDVAAKINNKVEAIRAV